MPESPTPPAKKAAAPPPDKADEHRAAQAKVQQEQAEKAEQQEKDGEDETNSSTADDSFDQMTPPAYATTKDAMGVERIIVPDYGDGWEPAEVEPKPEDVERAKVFQERQEKASQERLAKLGLDKQAEQAKS